MNILDYMDILEMENSKIEIINLIVKIKKIRNSQTHTYILPKYVGVGDDVSFELKIIGHNRYHVNTTLKNNC